jgi:hypothetical protein
MSIPATWDSLLLGVPPSADPAAPSSLLHEASSSAARHARSRVEQGQPEWRNMHQTLQGLPWLAMREKSMNCNTKYDS